MNIDHPAQKRVTPAIADMIGCDLSADPVARAACGIPTFHMPLRCLATGMAQLANPSTAGSESRRGEAASEYHGRRTLYVNGTGGLHLGGHGYRLFGSPEGRR